MIPDRILRIEFETLEFTLYSRIKSFREYWIVNYPPNRIPKKEMQIAPFVSDVDPANFVWLDLSRRIFVLLSEFV